MLSETTVSTKVFPMINKLKEERCFEENPREDSWVKHERHFFIVTDSARPVYVRYGDENNVTPLLCTIVTFSGQLNRDGGQTIQSFVSGDKLFVFYIPSPFIFVCVSSVRLPVKLIQRELKYLEYIIFSLLTPGIVQRLQMRPNFDIKKQTETSESLFTSMLDLMDQTHTFVFNDCVPMSAVTTKRSEFKRILCKNHVPSCSCVLMFYRGELLCKITNSNFTISTEDIAILHNSAENEDQYEITWTPIWLPSHAEMLHILRVNFTKFGCKMIFIAHMIDASPECTNMYLNAANEFAEMKLDSSMCGIKQFNAPGLLHYIVCNRKLLQVHAPYIEDCPLSRVIYRAYAWTEDILEEHPAKGIFYVASEQVTIVGKQTPTDITMLALKVGTPAPEAEKIYAQFEEYFNKNRDVFFDYEQIYFDEK